MQVIAETQRLQYSYKTIVQALLLAPLPLLLFMALFMTLANLEFSVSSILAILFAHAVVYLVYCLVAMPFTFLVSWILAKLHWLNLFSIILFSFVFTGIFFSWLWLGTYWISFGLMVGSFY